MADPAELRRRFAWHTPPDDLTAAAHSGIREACLALAVFLNDLLPDSDEKRRALDAADDCMKHANAAVARRGVGTPAVPAQPEIPSART